MRTPFLPFLTLLATSLAAHAAGPETRIRSEPPPAVTLKSTRVTASVLVDAPTTGTAFTLEMAGKAVTIAQGDTNTDDEARPDLYRIALLPVRDLRLTDVVCNDERTGQRLPAEVSFENQSIAFAPGFGNHVICTFRLQTLVAQVTATVLANVPTSGTTFTLEMAGEPVVVPQGETTTDASARPDLYRIALRPVRGFRLLDIVCVDQATDRRLPANIDFENQSVAFAPGQGGHALCTFRMQALIAQVTAVVLADVPTPGQAFTLQLGAKRVQVEQGEPTTDDAARHDLYRIALLPVRGQRLSAASCRNERTGRELPAEVDHATQSIAFAPGIDGYALCTLRLESHAASAVADPGSAGRFRYDTAWALAGPCCGDTAHDVAVDADGSFFIVGNYGALDLDRDGKVDLESEGGHDAIVLKARPSGDIAWIRAPRSPAMAFARLSVAADGHGGAFVSGGFRDSMRFRSGERIQARGDYDGLLVRYGADGTARWARAIGGKGLDWLVGVSVDRAGNAYVAGTVQGAVDLDSDGRPEGSVAGKNGLLVASYDAGGKLRWGRIAASQADINLPAVAATAAGTVHVSARYDGSGVDLDGNGTMDLPAPGSAGAFFIAAFDSAGVLAKARAVRDAGSSRVVGLSHTADGDLLAIGIAAASIDLDGNDSVDVKGTESRKTPFVARFDGAGHLTWVRSLRTSGRLSPTHVAASSRYIAVSGSYEGLLDLDHPGSTPAAAGQDGDDEGIVVILDYQGTLRQVLTITGPAADQAKSAAFSPDGHNLSVTGFVRLTADFDGDGVPEGAVRCDHRGDIFWARYTLDP